MERKLSKDTCNTQWGRFTSETEAVGKLWKCSAYCHTAKHWAVVIRQENSDNCRLFSPRVYWRNKPSYTQSGWPSSKKRLYCKSPVTERESKTSQQTAFPSAIGLQRDDSQDSKMEEDCFKLSAHRTNWCSLATFKWMPQILAFSHSHESFLLALVL